MTAFSKKHPDFFPLLRTTVAALLCFLFLAAIVLGA
jgi:hypothetical protein